MDKRTADIEIEEVVDADELTKAHQQREQFDRNSAWLQAHIAAIYAAHRGQYICIAGQELFVGDTLQDAIIHATTAHPDDAGWFTRYIPKEKVARIYAV
jgi:hypothetical protein